MEFEWDRRKAVANRKKHGVDFADAVAVLYDDLAVTIEDDHPDEERRVTLGCDALGNTSLPPCVKGCFGIKVGAEEHTQLPWSDLPAEIVILQSDLTLIRVDKLLRDQIHRVVWRLPAQIYPSQVDPWKDPSAIYSPEGSCGQA